MYVDLFSSMSRGRLYRQTAPRMMFESAAAQHPWCRGNPEYRQLYLLYFISSWAEVMVMTEIPDLIGKTESCVFQYLPPLNIINILLCHKATPQPKNMSSLILPCWYLLHIPQIYHLPVVSPLCYVWAAVTTGAWYIFFTICKFQSFRV